MTSKRCKIHDIGKKKKVIVTAGAIDVILVCPECEREQNKFNFDVSLKTNHNEKSILSSVKSGGS